MSRDFFKVDDRSNMYVRSWQKCALEDVGNGSGLDEEKTFIGFRCCTTNWKSRFGSLAILSFDDELQQNMMVSNSIIGVTLWCATDIEWHIQHG